MPEIVVQLRTPDNVRLAGTLTTPEQPPSRAVVLLHGINADRHEYLGLYDHLAARLAEAGVASLRIDFRAHGESTYPDQDMTIAGLMLDAGTAVREMLHRFHDLTDLTIMGTSFGGAPALFAAEAFDEVKGAVLLAPVLDYEMTFLRPSTEWAAQSFSPAAQAAVLDKGYLLLDKTFRIGAKALAEMRLIRPLDAVCTFGKPLVIIHGDADPMVPAEQSRRAAALNPSIETRLVAGMDHGFMDIDDPEGTSARSLENRDLIVAELIRCALAERG